MGHQRGALGDRQDEDEVEEELQRFHLLAFARHRRKAGSGFRAHPDHRALLASRRDEPRRVEYGSPVSQAPITALISGASSGIGEATARRLSPQARTTAILLP